MSYQEIVRRIKAHYAGTEDQSDVIEDLELAKALIESWESATSTSLGVQEW